MKPKKAIPLKVLRVGSKRHHKHASYQCSMTLMEEKMKTPRPRSGRT